MKTVGAFLICLIPLTAHAEDACRVVEFPQRYEVSCNGQPAPPQPAPRDAAAGEAQQQPPQMPAWSHHHRPNPADIAAARAERARLITQDKEN